MVRKGRSIQLDARVLPVSRGQSLKSVLCGSKACTIAEGKTLKQFFGDSPIVCSTINHIAQGLHNQTLGVNVRIMMFLDMNPTEPQYVGYKSTHLSTPNSPLPD